MITVDLHGMTTTALEQRRLVSNAAQWVKERGDYHSLTIARPSGLMPLEKDNSSTLICLMGMKIATDENVPENEILVRDESGNVLVRIKGFGR